MGARVVRARDTRGSVRIGQIIFRIFPRSDCCHFQSYLVSLYLSLSVSFQTTRGAVCGSRSGRSPLARPAHALSHAHTHTQERRGKKSPGTSMLKTVVNTTASSTPRACSRVRVCACACMCTWHIHDEHGRQHNGELDDNGYQDGAIGLRRRHFPDIF